MGTIWLLVAMTQTAVPPPVEITTARPRFAAGAEFGGGIVAGFEGGAVPVAGAGVRVTIPLGGRFAFDARALHMLPTPDGGIYELRVRRAVGWRGPLKPDYAGIGAVGYYALDTGLYGKLKPRIGYVSPPLMASFVAGWENRTGARRAMPFEVSVVVHPYGLIGVSATLGVTWARAAHTIESHRTWRD